MPNNPALELSLSRTIHAPRAAVYVAWTRPEIMARWFAPRTMRVTQAEADVRVGGGFRVQVEGDDCAGVGGVHIVAGTYRAIEPGRRLCFTWSRSGHPGPETLVTVELRDASGGGTELHLTHAGFADGAAAERHRGGWEVLLDILAGLALATD